MKPPLLVVLTFLVSTALNVLYWYHDQEPNPYLDGILFGVLAAAWVKLDSQKRNVYFPTDWVLFFAIIGHLWKPTKNLPTTRKLIFTAFALSLVFFA